MPTRAADGPVVSTPVVNRAHQSEFTDPNGVIWRRRGAEVADKRLRRLMSDRAVRVVHDYMGPVQEVRAEERDAFWERAEERDAFWESALLKMRESPHSDFIAAEFKNESHEHLLVIHEYC